MKRIVTLSLAVLAAASFATTAFALAPNPNGVHVQLKYLAPWEAVAQCPVSVSYATLNYPASIAVTDSFIPCTGWMNNHIWQYSEDGGASGAAVHPDDNFKYGADLVIDGSSAQGGEAYINLCPWWVAFDGRINVKGGFGGGEVAAFGGFMPFVTWTDPGNSFNYWGSALSYVKGTTIGLEIQYLGGPTGPSVGSPGMVTYKVHYGGTDYVTPGLPINVGDTDKWALANTFSLPASDNQANQIMAGGGMGDISDGPNVDTYMRATWSNVYFTNLQSTATKTTTWGAMKALYR
jgi:hypothetical protein